MSDVPVMVVVHPDWPGEPALVEVRDGAEGLEIRIWSHPDAEVREVWRSLWSFTDYVQAQVRAGVSRGREGA